MGCSNSTARPEISNAPGATEGPLTTKQFQSRLDCVENVEVTRYSHFSLRHAYISFRGYYPDSIVTIVF